MNGGDLDGDVYIAIWDSEILSHLSQKDMYPPADYFKFIPDPKTLP